MSSPRPLRVLQVFRTYMPDTRGGMQEVIRQIARATAALGTDNRIFTPSPDPNPAILQGDGATVIRVPLNFEIQSCGFCLTGLGKFRRQVEWADVVHYHFPWPFQDVMHFAARVNKPTVITYHADIIRQRSLLRFYTPLMNRFLDSADAIVATSETYSETSPVLSKRRDKLTVIPLALDECSYPSPDEATLSSVRERFGEDFFFFVGMLRWYKGLDILVDACAHTGARVVIAGTGPLEASLHARARELGLDNVTFAGEVDDTTKMALFRLSRGVVVPSPNRAEAFGVTLLEGAMQGKPLITARIVSGTQIVNLHEETGLCVAAGDAGELAAAMDRLASDDVLAQRLGQGARRRFEEKFTAAAMGRRYVDLYQHLAERHACRR